jgi:hypothetical protein
VGSVEERLALIEERLSRVVELLNGGPSTPWKRSLRGRLHDVENELDAARLARQALDEVKRERRRHWSYGQRWFALLVAAAGLSSPYILHALHWQ